MARPRSVSAADLDSTPFERKIALRGTVYRFRELSIGEYDDLQKKATTSKTNALGEDIETLDNTLLLRLMVLKCCISPKLSPDRLSEMSMAVVRRLNKLVNEMHFDDIKEDKVEEEEDEAEDGEAKGNE